MAAHLFCCFCRALSLEAVSALVVLSLESFGVEQIARTNLLGGVQNMFICNDGLYNIIRFDTALVRAQKSEDDTANHCMLILKVYRY